MSLSKLRQAIEALREPMDHMVEGRVVAMTMNGAYSVTIGGGTYTIPARNGASALPGQRVGVLVKGKAMTPIAMLGAYIG